jgi:hypothetical protein
VRTSGGDHQGDPPGRHDVRLGQAGQLIILLIDKPRMTALSGLIFEEKSSGVAFSVIPGVLRYVYNNETLRLGESLRVGLRPKEKAMTTKESYLKDLMGHALQILYMVFLGIIIAIFCGLGIDTFYPGPTSPDYPITLQQDQYKETPTTRSSEELEVQKEYDAAQIQYQNDLEPYARNVSMIALVLSVIALTLSLTVLAKWEVIANGVLLGGIFTMGYSIIMGMQGGDPKFRFFLVTVGVAITFVLGYMKFVRPNKE